MFVVVVDRCWYLLFLFLLVFVLFFVIILLLLLLFVNVRIQYAIDNGDTIQPFINANDNKDCNRRSGGSDATAIRFAESTPKYVHKSVNVHPWTAVPKANIHHRMDCKIEEPKFLMVSGKQLNFIKIKTRKGFSLAEF